MSSQDAGRSSVQDPVSVTPQHPSSCFRAGNEPGDSLLKTNPNAATESLPRLLDAMHSLAVIPAATCVMHTELLQLRQKRDKPFRTFTAKIRGKAETCSYATKCTYGALVDYIDHVIRDVILNGLYERTSGGKCLAHKTSLRNR